MGTMTSLGSLIPPNPHRYIQHVKIITLKESVLKFPLPQSLSPASINEIIVKLCNQWYKDLHEYLKQNIIPPSLSPIEKCIFKQKATRYAILEDVVYKRSYDGILLLCLELVDQSIAIYTYNDGICGGHFNGTIISNCILQMGCYWLTMEKDYQYYVKKYVKYQ